MSSTICHQHTNGIRAPSSGRIAYCNRTINTMQVLPLVIACFFGPTLISAAGFQVEMERIEQIGGEHLLDLSGVRVRKFNRTVSVLDGTFMFLKDIDDSYEFAVTAARSALGNNQFNEYPMKVSRKNACRIFREDYVEYQHIWANHTNLPQIGKGEEPFCPLPKGEYWVKNFAPDASWVPPVAPEGYWRLTMELYGPTGKLDAQIREFLRIKKDFM